MKMQPEGMRMEVLIHSKYGLLAETINLICAYVSGVDPAILTVNDPACMPVEQVRRIMGLVCEGIDRENRRMQLFFRGFTTKHPHDSRPFLRCVASVMLYSCTADMCCDLQSCREALHNSRLGLGQPYEITSFCLGLGVAMCDDYRFLADELWKVDMPEDLRLSLAVVLSAYHEYVELLCNTLEPLALRLKPLLEPWEERLQSKIEQWHSALDTEEKQQKFISSRINSNLRTLKKLELTPHLLYPKLHSAMFTLSGNVCCYRAGVALLLEDKHSSTLPVGDIAALQLLSNVDRVRMLQAMSGRGMQPKELAHELDINRGKVFHDLSNLIQAHLVEPVFCDDRLCYTTNVDLLDKTMERVAQFIKQGSKK